MHKRDRTFELTTKENLTYDQITMTNRINRDIFCGTLEQRDQCTLLRRAEPTWHVVSILRRQFLHCGTHLINSFSIFIERRGLLHSDPKSGFLVACFLAGKGGPPFSGTIQQRPSHPTLFHLEHRRTKTDSLELVGIS